MMKCHRILLLLWVMTVSVSSETGDIKVQIVPDAIEVSCWNSKIQGQGREANGTLTLKYADESSGEYSCVNNEQKIYVKFRTCDNCVEMDWTSITAIATGNLVATILIGVAVYWTASHTRIDPVTSHKKGSDRQHLVPNEVSARPSNDHYQALTKGGQRDMYDVLTNRR